MILTRLGELVKSKLYQNAIYIFAVFILVSCGAAKSRQDEPATTPAAAAALGKEPTAPKARVQNSEKHQGIGFYDINADVIPGVIKKASLSVFEIFVMAGQDGYLKTFDVSTEASLQQAKKAVAQLSTQGFSKNEILVMTIQLDHCVAPDYKGDAKECTVSADLRRSTGVLIGKGDEMWVNAHALEGFFKLGEKYGQVSSEDIVKNKMPVRIFAFDSSDALVLDSYKDTVLVAQLPALTKQAQTENTYYSLDSDYVKLKLSRPLGVPLVRATVPAHDGDSVYLAGFPSCTNCTTDMQAEAIDLADRGEGLNSDGKGLKFTYGSLLPTSEALSVLGADKKQLQVDLSRVLFYSADSVQGLSGAPILNIRGEVLGLHTGGKGLQSGGHLRRVSRGVLLP
jgi:hypothetical protein